MRFRRWMVVVAVPLLALGVLAVLFSWSWFIPMVEVRASAALGQPVTIGGLGVRLGRVTEVQLRDVVVANPAGFQGDAPFARVRELTVRLDVMAYLRGDGIVLPAIAVRGGDVQARLSADGVSNLALAAPSPALGNPATPTPAPAPGPRVRIGSIRVDETTAHVVYPELRGDVTAQIETREMPTAGLVVTAEGRGTYAGQPLTASFIGGTIADLNTNERPWPIALSIQNGRTEATVEGRLRDPFALAGADLRLSLAGPDLAMLTPLTGVPIPQTPPFRVAGRLDYSETHYRFTEIDGLVGRTDIGGTLTIDPRGRVPDVTAALRSRRVDLRDLAGFIGGQPVRGTPVRPDAAASGRVLPNAPVNVPKFEAANVHLQYEAGQVLGNSTPLDNLRVSLELVDGIVTIRPLRFGVGSGAIEADIVLTPQPEGTVQAVAGINFQQVDIARLMSAAGSRGGGALNGRARIESTGRSLAELLARGNGNLFLSTAGGNLSAFLVDISGLRLGNALLSGLGLPDRTELRCFVADFVLRRGVLESRATLLETADALISASGTVRLSDERIDMRLRSESKRPTVGALPTALLLTGSFSDPSIAPEVVELGVRGGLAVALGFAALPLALLPTIELGIGDDPRCADMRARVRRR
ncbi:AsmA family protein [Plastoroseomonas arctica]|uniref:AsmA family protein n=1 Tax=Plastoroseomonas arctica TaxID=1509237 RepID=A0AAF1KJU6_9PROT|nr:AsmA family protein [Plastoroseomonas arctica]MBR0655079.1 AsmA family protein [Plastoroseomonas arctica]